MQGRGGEFRAEAKQRRAWATVEDESHVVSWPQSTAAWVDWLGRHEQTYEDAMQAVKACARRVINQRVV
eukprot:11201834-Lingulodinium_polyedra.AAC.1